MMQEKIAESEERYRLMFDLSSAIMLLIDAVNGSIYDANKAACEFYGYTKTQLLKMNIMDINLTQSFIEFGRLSIEIKQSGKKHLFFKHKLANGELKDVEVYTTFEVIGDRELLFSVIHDITEAITMKKALEESELRYRTMFENSSAMMVLIDPEEGKIWDVNSAACEFYGYTKEQFKGMLITDYNKTIKSNKLERFPEVKKGTLRWGIYKHALSTGELRDVEVHLSAIVIKGKDLLLSINHDITERIKTEKELEHYREHLEDIVKERTAELELSEQRFKRLAENTPDSIMLFGKDRKVQYANPTVMKRNPYLKENVIGKTLSEFGLKEDVAKNAVETMEKVFRTKEPDIRDGYMQDGRVVEFLNIPVLDASGEVEMILSYGRDVTQRKKLEDSLNEAIMKQKEINELKLKLISTVSDEFRTPLSAILSATELLERYGRKWEEDKYYLHIEKIRRSIDSLTRLVEDVLTLGKVESEKIEFNPAWTDLKSLCLEVLDQAKIIASENHVFTIDINIRNEKYYIDERLFIIIFVNLVTNAVKYSPNGGRVSFSVSEDKDGLTFEISDEGIGIKDEDMKVLYEPFFRADEAKNIPGTGLGMPIVKEAVELYKGSISVTSIVNKGTTVRVFLPIIKN